MGRDLLAIVGPTCTGKGTLALAVADALGGRLWGVRLDTSESLVDRSLWEEMGDFRPTGVNEQLVWKVRNALDSRGYDAVRIVVSGGFTVEKIRSFEANDVPVDAYGVGSYLFDNHGPTVADFTADVVRVRLPSGWIPMAKVGRQARDNPDLERVL